MVWLAGSNHSGYATGARIFNAATALGVPMSRIVEKCDSVTFCLSKVRATVAHVVGVRRPTHAPLTVVPCPPGAGCSGWVHAVWHEGLHLPCPPLAQGAGWWHAPGGRAGGARHHRTPGYARQDRWRSRTRADFGDWTSEGACTVLAVGGWHVLMLAAGTTTRGKHRSTTSSATLTL